MASPIVPAPRATQSPAGRRQVVSSSLMLASRLAQTLIGMAAFITLARLLTPRDFGIVAMATVFTSIAAGLEDFGLSSAVAASRRLRSRQLDDLFRFQTTLNVAICLVLIALAPALAWFYGEPAVLPVALVLTAGIFILGTSVLPRGLLQRRMHFGRLSAAGLATEIAAATLAILLALRGAGHWAIAIQTAAAHILLGAWLWLGAGWRPRLTPANPATPADADLRRFGAQVTAGKLLRQVSRRLDRILIGRFAGAETLGLYQQAHRWAWLPLQQVHGPLLAVNVSGFRRMTDRPAALRRHVRGAFTAVYAILLPALAFLFIEADTLIPTLLGPHWAPAVPFFRLLLIATAGAIPTQLCKHLYLAQRRTGRQLAWQAIDAAVYIAAVSIGAFFGALGIAAGIALATLATIFPAALFCVRGTTLHLADILLPAWRPLLATAAAAGAILLAARQPLAAAPLQLILHAGLFAAVFIATWMLLPGGRHHALWVLHQIRPAPPAEGDEP